jgi:hypothetical protein
VVVAAEALPQLMPPVVVAAEPVRALVVLGPVLAAPEVVVVVVVVVVPPVRVAAEVAVTPCDLDNGVGLYRFS